MSVKLSLEKYSRRNSGIKRSREKKAKNERPEKLVEKEVIGWLERNGFAVSVVESKAVYSVSAGRYLNGQTEAGFSDVVGVDKLGRAVFIELKAKGRRNTISYNQVEFLKARILRHAFCACTDDVDHLASLYISWSDIKLRSADDAKQFLFDNLPKTKHGDDTDEISW